LTILTPENASDDNRFCSLSVLVLRIYLLSAQKDSRNILNAVILYSPDVFYKLPRLSLRFSGHFPGEPGLAGVYWSKGWWRWWVV